VRNWGIAAEPVVAFATTVMTAVLKRTFFAVR
jgi:hypothetical protein